MNKTYKKVFNARRGKYVAVDETKTGHGQMGTCTVGGQKPSVIKAAVVGAMVAMGMTPAISLAEASTLTQVDADHVVARTAQIIDQNTTTDGLNSLTVSGASGQEEYQNGIKVSAEKTTYSIKADIVDKDSYVKDKTVVSLWSPQEYIKEDGSAGMCPAWSTCQSYKFVSAGTVTGYKYEEGTPSSETLTFVGENETDWFEKATHFVAEEGVKSVALASKKYDVLLTDEQKATLANGGTITIEAYSGVDLNSYEASTDWRELPGDTATLTNNKSGLTVAGDLDVNADGHLVNNKSINVQGQLTISGHGGVSSVENTSSESSLVVEGGTSITGGSSLTNAGSFLSVSYKKDSEGNVVTDANNDNQPVIDSFMAISGSGSITNSGTFVAGAIEAGSITQTAGSFVAMGDVEVEDGDITNSGYFQVGDITASVDGEETVKSNLTGKNYHQTAGSTVVTGNATISNKLDIDAGSVQVGGSVFVGSLTGGTTVENAGNLTIVNGGSLGTVADWLIDNAFGNNDLLGGLIDGDSFTAGYVQVGGSLTNADGGNITVQNKDSLSILLNTSTKNDGAQAAFGDLVVLGGNVENVNKGNLSASDMYIVGSTLSNGSDSHVTADSMIVVGSSNATADTITNDGQMTINGSNLSETMSGFITDSLDDLGLGDAASGAVNALLGSSGVSLGYIQINGQLTNGSSGQLVVDGGKDEQGKEVPTVSAVVNGNLINNGTAQFDNLVSAGSQITNNNKLEADTLVIAGGQLTNNAASEEGKPAGNVTADTMIFVGIDDKSVIDNDGTITVTGNTGMGELLSGLLSSDALDGVTGAGKDLINGLFTEADKLSIGYVQVGGKLDNEGTLTAGGLSGLVSATVENNGTLGFGNLIGVSSTINNNAGANLTADNLYLIGGTLTNDAKDGDKVAGSVTVNNSLIAIGMGSDNTLIDNAGDMTIKGGGTIGDALTAVAPTFATSDVGQIVTSVLDMSTLSAGYVQMSGKLNNTGNFTVEGGVSGLVAGQINNDGTMSFNDMIVYQGTITNTSKFDADNLVVVDGTLTGAIEGDEYFKVGSMIVGGKTTNDTTVTVEGQNQLGTLALNAIGAENLDKLGEVGKFVKGAFEATDVKLGYVQVAANLTNTGSIDANGISGMVGGEINNEGSLSFNEFIAYNGTISNVGQFEADNMVVIGSTLKGDSQDANFTVGSLIATGSNTNETNVTIEGNNKLGTTILNVIGSDKLKELGEVGAYVEDALEAANIKLAYAQVGGEFTNKGSITVADGVSGLVAGNLKNEGVLSFNEFVSYQGTIDNAASFNADNMIVVGGELKNAGELTAGALIGAATTITNTNDMIVTGSDAFADAIENYIPKNEDGSETTYGKLATALLDKAHSVGYVQVGGKLDNAATGTLTATGVDKQVASGLVSGEIANKGTMTFDDFVSISGTIANEGQFKADDLVLVSGSLTNGTHADVEKAPTVTAQSLIAAGTTIKNQDGAVIDVTGSEVNHFVVDALDAYLPKDQDGNDTTLSTTVKNVLNAKEVEVGLVAVQGTKIENNGKMDVDGVSGLLGSSVSNTNELTFKDQLLAINSDIANTSTLNGQWILGVNSSIVNGEETAKGTLDADIVGLYQSDLTNHKGSEAVIDSLMALGSTVTNDGTLTTNRGLEMSAEQKADLVKIAAAVGVEISGLDINAEANLGYVGIDSTMTNNGQWDVSNAVTLRGSIENAGQLNVEGVLMATGTNITNTETGTLNTTGGVTVDFGTAENPYVVDVGYAQIGGSLINEGTWNTDHTMIAGGSVENKKTMNVYGQLINAGGEIVNGGTLQNTAGLHIAGVEVDVGYVQLGGSMTNNKTWNVSDITAAAGSITNAGELTSGDVVLSDTDIANSGIAKVNGHLVMTEVALGEFTNLSNSNEMTVTGLTTLNNIKMDNSGTLTMGNGNVDGLLAIKSELTNNGTWNTTNLTMVGGSLVNETGKDLTVSGLMTVGGALEVDGLDVTFGADVTNTGTLKTTGAIKTTVGDLELDLGYIQVAGSMTNNGTWTTDHTLIAGGSVDNKLTMTVNGQLNNIGGHITNAGELSTMKGIEVDGKVWNAGYVQTAGSMTNTGTWNASEVYSIGGTITNENAMTAEALTLLGNAVANNTSGTLTTSKQALVSESSQVNLAGGQWNVQGSLANEGSIKGNGTMNLIGGAVASNTMESTFEVGTLNIAGGSTLMHGIGIDATQFAGKDILAIGKTLTIKNANIGVSEMTLASSDGAVAKFGSNSATIADAQSFKGDQFMFASTSNTKLDVDAGATLLLTNVGHGGQYNLAEGFDAANSTVDGTIYTTDDTRGTDLNWLFKVTPGAEGSTLYVNATLESIADSKLYNAGGWNVLHKNIVDEILRTALADKPQASTMSLRATAVADAEVGFTHKMYGDLFMNEKITAGTKVMVSNSLASVAQNVGVESLALENVTDTMKGIEERVSMAGSTFADGKMVDGKSSNLWAHVLGGEHKQDGLKSAGGGSLGYDADDRGFMIGYDYLDGANNARCGFALSYIDGNVNSVGTHLGTTADYSTLGLHAYLNWMPTDNVNMIATFGFSRNRAEAEMNLPQLEGWNYSKATADVDTNVLSLGVRAETNFTYNNVNIVPHAGLRVMLIDVDNYDTKVDGNTAFNNSADIAAIGQLPFGVTVKGEFDKNGWNVKPMADLTFVPQFGETKSQLVTTLPGSTVSDSVNAEFTGNFATTMTLGVEAEKGDYSLGMQLGVTKGQNGKTDSNFMAKVRYQF